MGSLKTGCMCSHGNIRDPAESVCLALKNSWPGHLARKLPITSGIYLYDAFHHTLIPEFIGDLRALAIGAGQINFGANAPVRLIYVADVHRLTHTSGFQEPGLQDPEVQKSYYFVDTGLIAGNVYLFAASHGLASWFHNCNKSGLASKLKLRPEQRVLFGQTVGYPLKK